MTPFSFLLRTWLVAPWLEYQGWQNHGERACGAEELKSEILPDLNLGDTRQLINGSGLRLRVLRELTLMRTKGSHKNYFNPT
jgi:hypothetical protein